MCRGKEIFSLFLFYFQDGNPTLGDCRRDNSLSALLNVAALNDFGYSLERYDESPGVYYENKGVAVLCNTPWRTVAYVNLNKIGNETFVLRQYVHHVDILCQKTVVRNLTGCAHFANNARERLNQLTKTEGLLKEITGQETGSKRKRGGGCLTL
jgi:hypothetical protein